MLLHHFDGFEDPTRWWQPCPENCGSWNTSLKGGLSALRQRATQRYHCRRCSRWGDRLSAIAVYSGQRRIGRRRIPIVTRFPGLVLRPNATTLRCAFAGDGGSVQWNCRNRFAGYQRHPGCISGCGNPPAWCSPRTERGGCRCGIGEGCAHRPVPLKPESLGWLLQEHASFGEVGRGVGSYSGYAELVVDSKPLLTSPREAVEAFFFSEAESDSYNASMHLACKVYRASLRHVQQDACEVPLLKFRTDNWATPFQPVQSECPLT